MAAGKRKQTRTDPILVSIIANRLEGIAEEMAQTLMMTSRSGIFAEARDFVTGIVDAEGRLVAQSRYFPGFAGALPYIVPPVTAHFAGDLEDGDIVLVNHPFMGNSHLPDMNVLKPVIWDGELQFWAICKGHMADIGGAGVAGYDPTGETIWDEGVIVPPTKLYEAGRYREDVLDLIVSQVKLPDIVRGDILCEVGGANIGERGLHALFERYGAATVREHVNAFLDASEKTMREKTRTIPDGTYRGEASIDNDVASENPLTVRVTVEVRRGRVRFDFSDSDRQSPRYMNCTDAFTRSMATLTLFWILEHKESNDGSLRCVEFVNPAGTCVNPQFPHSTVLATCNIAEAIQEAVQLALAEAVPDKVATPSTKLIFPMITYVDPERGRLDINLDFFFRCNPSGATLGYDGWEQGGPAQEMGMGRCPDPEIHELSHPVLIERFEQEPDTAGAGRYRGGNGHVYRVRHFADSVNGVVFGSGTRPHAVPRGLFGGHNPEPSRLTIEHADGSREPILLNSFFTVRSGDLIELRSMGAPGYGNPLDREPGMVARDVLDGYMTVSRARDTYGVIVDATGKVDVAATDKLRRKLAARSTAK